MLVGGVVMEDGALQRKQGRRKDVLQSGNVFTQPARVSFFSLALDVSSCPTVSIYRIFVVNFIKNLKHSFGRLF